MACTAMLQSILAGSRHNVPTRSAPLAAAQRAPGVRRQRLSVSAVAAPVSDEEAVGSQRLQQLQQQAVTSSDSLTPAAVAAAARGGRIVLESPDELKSTWGHRAWVWGGSALMVATLAQGLAQIDSLETAAGAAAAVVAAYFISDASSAVYHWGVDNYGDGNTPVFGGQIAAFQGHHQRPWTITEREFCNNLHKLFAPATPFAVGLLGLSVAGAPVWWDVWSSTFLFLCCMSQQLHAWSHMKKSELPGPIVALQDAGLLISRKDHGAHHKSPFNCKYAIVSGWCNPLLDGDSPEASVWYKMEHYILDTWGIEPRSWSEPGEAWSEQERPGTSA